MLALASLCTSAWSKFSCAQAVRKQSPAQFEVVESLPIGRVPAGFPVGFALLTSGEQQYVGYFDEQRRMTIASRLLTEKTWRYQVLPSKIGWDSHNYVTMAVDLQGRLHVTGNMHGDPLVYFVTEAAGDISTLQKRAMTGKREGRVTYPRFLENHEGKLVFTYVMAVLAMACALSIYMTAPMTNGLVYLTSLCLTVKANATPIHSTLYAGQTAGSTLFGCGVTRQIARRITT